MNRLLKTTLIVCLIFGFNSTLKAQNQEDVTNEWKAMIENILPSFLNASANQFEGLAISFVYGDSSWTTSVGQANDTGLAIDPDGKWLFRSFTKMITSVVIHQLYEDDLLTLTDPISEYLDPIANVNMSDTIEDLLHMRSRMCKFIDNVLVEVDEDKSAILDTRTVLETYLPIGPCNEDRVYDYNDANFQVLGLIIEAVTGQSGEEVYHERIFEPFGMDSTALAPLDLERNEFNGLYRSVKDSNDEITTFDESMESLNSFLTSQKFSAGVMGSTKDMLKLTKALLDGSVISDTSLAIMKSNPFSEDYGKGLMIQEMRGELGGFDFVFDTLFPGKFFGHGGAARNTSRTFYDPERKIGFSFAFNSSTPSFDAVFNAEKFKENMYRLMRKCIEDGGCSVPQKPNLLLPINDSELDTLVVFSWYQSPRAKSYNFELSTQEDFSSVLYDSSLTDTSMALDEEFDNNTQYFWRVKAIGDDGGSEWSEVFSFSYIVVSNEVTGKPNQFTLSQNYPNPFNPSTNISFELPQSSVVQLKVYNLLGQEVANLMDGRMNSGNHSVNFDASQLSSGVYIYRLVAGNQSITKKMMLIK